MTRDPWMVFFGATGLFFGLIMVALTFVQDRPGWMAVLGVLFASVGLTNLAMSGRAR